VNAAKTIVAKILGLLGVVGAVCTPALIGHAQTFPTRPIRIVVPFAPGTAADTLTRLVGTPLASRLDQPVVIDNRPGATGNIGAEHVARSEPDGHTLLSAPPPPLAINQSLFPKLGFDPAAFVPVTIIASAPNVLTVSSEAKFATLEELIATAKAAPDKLNGGSSGVGSTPHLSLEMLKAMAGISIKHIPYSKGLAPALADLLANRIDLMFMNLADALPHIRSGKLRALAVASRDRVPELPGVATMAETLADFESTTWYAIVAPPGTPPQVATRLSREIAEILRLSDVAARLKDLSAQPVGSTPDETGEFIRREADRWRRIIAAAGIRPE
jgi:tripartite-type tricarboxylate transporter receptor subunit TctC